MSGTSFKVGGKISPPSGTYEKEPEEEVALSTEIRQIKFNTCKQKEDVYLYSIQVNEKVVMPRKLYFFE